MAHGSAMRAGLLCLFLLLGSASLMGQEARVLMILGDSLTAGLGLENPAVQGWPARLQERFDRAGLRWLVVSAGLSGDTSAGGLRRIDWLLRRKPDAFILALGANDGLRGLTPESTRANLAAILDKVRAKNPDTLLFVAGMQMPPNLGPDYTERYRSVFSSVAKEKDAQLIPFLLEGVGGVRELNQDDGIHPNARGHELMAAYVWEQLKDRFLKRSAPTGN